MAFSTARAVAVWSALLGIISVHIHTVKALTPERRYACWGSFGPPVVSAQCPRNTAIQVLRAGLKVQQHGGLCAYNHNDCGCEYGQSGCQMPDVRRLCMGRPACRLDVTQQYISTKQCKGFSDYMYIEFNCVPVEHNSVVSEICSAVNAKSKSGFLRSPAGPAAALAGRECDCTLTTDATSSIQLTVLDIQTRDYKCDNDKLLVAYDGRTDKYCGEQPDNKSIISKSAVVSVKYGTDRQGEGGSFWLKYEAEPKADVKLVCTYTEKKVASKPALTVVEKRISRKKTTNSRRPSTNLEWPTAAKREKMKEPKQKDEEKSAKTKHKPPWWWKFVKSTKTPNPIRKAIKPPTTPPVLVDDSKPLLRSNLNGWHQGARASTTTTTTSERHHHYQHPKLVQASKGKSSISSTTPNAKLPLSQSIHSFIDKSGRRWSHLPKSLLNKLQFPVPMIRALEKELVVALKGNRRTEPYLRILPDLEPTQTPLPLSHKLNTASPSRSHSARRHYDPHLVTSLHSNTHSKDMHPQHTSKYSIHSQAKHPPASYEPKPRYSDSKDVDFKLPRISPTTPKPRATSAPQETVHSLYQYTPAMRNDLPMAQLATGKQNNAKYPHTFSRMKSPVVHKTTVSKLFATTVVPRMAKSSAKPLVTHQPKITAKSKPSTEPPLPKTTQMSPPTGTSRKSGSAKEQTAAIGQDDVIHYKKPISKEAVVHAQPAWAEPLEFPPEGSQVNPYPKVRSKSFKSRSKPTRSRRRYRQKGGGARDRAMKGGGSRDRYNPGGGGSRERGVSNKERLKGKLKHKPKKVWRERTDKTWVSVIRPEAKMYVPARRSHQKRLGKGSNLKDYEDDVLQRTSTMPPLVEGVVVVTTPSQSSKPATTSGAVLMDSVHRDDMMVVKNLAAKIETVSDFYTALDEEDWMQWPVFEMVKNAQEQESNRTNNATKVVTKEATTLSPRETPKPNVPKPTRPQPKHPVFKQAPHPLTTRRTYKKPAPTPPHTRRTARPAHFAKAPSIGRSVARLPSKSTKVSSVPYKNKTNARRRKPVQPATLAFVPSKSESLTRPKDNTVTIIAVAAVGSVLIVVVLGIVIRFIMNRKRDQYHGHSVSKSKRYKPQTTSDNHNFPGQKIPRPRRI